MVPSLRRRAEAAEHEPESAEELRGQAAGGRGTGHFNPAVTVGLASAGRLAWRDVTAYVVTQVVAAIVGAGVLFVIASGKAGFSASASGFATAATATAHPTGTP